MRSVLCIPTGMMEEVAVCPNESNGGGGSATYARNHTNGASVLRIAGVQILKYAKGTAEKRGVRTCVLVILWSFRGVGCGAPACSCGVWV